MMSKFADNKQILLFLNGYEDYFKRIPEATSMKIRNFLLVLFLCSFAVSCVGRCSRSGSSYDDSGLLQPNNNPLVYDMKVKIGYP